MTFGPYEYAVASYTRQPPSTTQNAPLCEALVPLREGSHRAPSHGQAGGLGRAQRAQPGEVGEEDLRMGSEKLFSIRQRMTIDLPSGAAGQGHPCLGGSRGQPNMRSAGSEHRPGDRDAAIGFFNHRPREASGEPHRDVLGERESHVEQCRRRGFGFQDTPDVGVAQRDDPAVVFVQTDFESVECDGPGCGSSRDLVEPQP